MSALCGGGGSVQIGHGWGVRGGGWKGSKGCSSIYKRRWQGWGAVLRSIILWLVCCTHSPLAVLPRQEVGMSWVGRGCADRGLIYRKNVVATFMGVGVRGYFNIQIFNGRRSQVTSGPLVGGCLRRFSRDRFGLHDPSCISRIRHTFVPSLFLVEHVRSHLNQPWEDVQ